LIFARCIDGIDYIAKGHWMIEFRRPMFCMLACKGVGRLRRTAKSRGSVSLLTPEQYRVTQQDGTKRPFQNECWDNKEPALYLDVVSGEPLFTSIYKFDGATD
jgi:SelR domain-containing protein